MAIYSSKCLLIGDCIVEDRDQSTWEVISLDQDGAVIESTNSFKQLQLSYSEIEQLYRPLSNGQHDCSIDWSNLLFRVNVPVTFSDLLDLVHQWHNNAIDDKQQPARRPISINTILQDQHGKLWRVDDFRLTDDGTTFQLIQDDTSTQQTWPAGTINDNFTVVS